MIKKQHHYLSMIKKINRLERTFRSFRKEDFSAKTKLFKMRLQRGETLKTILPEAFALAREAAFRILGLRAYDVQLLGAIAAHEGEIVEMKTGEGKTLAILFPAYLNSLGGNGVHVITANDYLAQRDAQWMKNVYNLLGISVNYITSQTNNFDRQVAYASDITYVTGNEVCFDYLKDNMAYDINEKRHRDFHYAIIDEADSVLIDEAQIPLVISDTKTASPKDKKLFTKLNPLIKQLKKGIDLKVNQKDRTVYLTIDGIKKLEKLIGVGGLYSEKNNYIYYVECLLKAHHLFKKDRDYIVERDEIIIVDEFTGRLMRNHRYYQGIHQAIETKESVSIKDENEILASITFQHFFGYYKKLAGFTGTAKEAEKEFRMLYDKKVFIVPPNKPIIRRDLPDLFFPTWDDKIEHLAWSVHEHFFKDQAALIGTRSIEKSYQVHKALLTNNIPSNVLNAKHTAREAEVISKAGQPQAVTVATNMAGRGTDIELNLKVKKAGGLAVYGTEKHNTKRIDNQLVGRAGRQGDPGQSIFFISADDDLINIHFRDEYEKRISKIKNARMGIRDKKLEKILNQAQKRMENMFFDQRILNFELDKVLEKQRNNFYRQRDSVLKSPNLKKIVLACLCEQFVEIIFKKRRIEKNKSKLTQYTAMKIKEEAEKIILNNWFKLRFPIKTDYSIIEMKSFLNSALEKYYQDFEDFYTSEKMRKLEKISILKIMDVAWTEYLKKVEQEQDAAIIDSINNSDFFDEYEKKMADLYQTFSYSMPRNIFNSFIRIIDNLWKK
jgi:preprotein translocase subunit SecA